MKAMVLHRQNSPLELKEVDEPVIKAMHVKVEVSCCGVCRTDLHVVDGDLTEPKLPLIPGHQIVGRVIEKGSGVEDLEIGDRIGIPWLGGSCGCCNYCQDGSENLCNDSVYTGYQLDGGFAEYCVADSRYCFPIPDSYSDIQAAPLLCAGLIGYRSYRKTGGGKRIGLYGFGASAHIIAQLAIFKGKEIYAFSRDDDQEARDFALSLGATWAGGSSESPPVELDSAIIFAPAGELVPRALSVVRKGGVVVCAGIHMSDIPSFPYSLLWEERTVTSVANLTKQDGVEFFELAANVPIKTHVHPYPLEKANDALDDLRHGRFDGQAVIVVHQPD